MTKGLFVFALVPFLFVAAGAAEAKSRSLPPYEIVQTKDTGEGNAVRLSLRVVVPKGTSRDDIPAVAEKIIDEMRQRKHCKTVEILFYYDKADIEGPFTVAGVQWAPLGVRNEMNIIFAGPPEDDELAPVAEAPAPETADDESPEAEEEQDRQKEIQKLVEDWRSAWEKKDLDGYLSFYSPHFRFQKMDLAAFRNKKKSVFEQPGDIRISVSDLRAEVAATSAVVSFLQHYESSHLSDWGKKTLYLTRLENGWKIVREDFEAVKPPAPEEK